LPARAARTQLPKLAFGTDCRRAACPAVNPSTSTNFTASARNSGV
jgi:hypothetical protein